MRNYSRSAYRPTIEKLDPLHGLAWTILIRAFNYKAPFQEFGFQLLYGR